MAQVGNEVARDALKHSAAYILRAAIAAVVPAAGPLASVHYDKRGAKLTLPYSGPDCSGERDKVEESANTICEQNTPLDQLKMPEADQEGMKSFETREAKEVVGVVVKKFTANPAKGQLVVEFIAGKKAELGAKKANHAVGVEKKELKDNAQKRQPPSEYDNVRQVSANIIGELIEKLKSEGISFEGKEETVKSLIAETIQTPLIMLKNTAYTNGFSSNISQPVQSVILKR